MGLRGKAMKILFKFFGPYKLAMGIALFFTILELAVELYQPVVMQIIIDDGIIAGNLDVVYGWGGLLLGLSLLAFIGGIINSFYAAKASQGIGYDIRKGQFHKIQEFAFHQFQKFPTSSLITRLTNDVTQIQNFIFMGLRIGLRAPLFILGGVIMAYTVNVKLANILIFSIPILLLITIWLLHKGVNLFQRVQRKLDSVNRVIRENLMAMRLVKAYAREDFEEERFVKVNTSLMDDNKRALRILELTMPILMLGMNAAMLVILWVGYKELNMGAAQAGEIVAVINYATRIMFSFTVFSFLMMSYSRSKASTSRIREVLEVETEELQVKPPELQRIHGDIEFEDVSFRYKDEYVLKDLSFSIKAGELVGILGETGSGKSSLFQLIPRLYEAAKGQILIDGKSIDSVNLDHLRSQIGLVPQEAHLFTGTVKENIQWGKNDASLEEVIQAAKEAEIHDFIMSLPEQYETKIGQKGVNFSGGQKQRLSIARALVRKPSILLLDDSTSALDARTEARILETLRNQSCTILLIAQKISSVKEADNILLLQDGKLIANGDHATLLAESSYYQKIYTSQAEEKGVGNGVS
jgi:ATP-binding cassette, subfamily B, multidrug efflux pump